MRAILVCLVLFVSFMFVGCEKISTGDNGTLYGSWKVRLDVPPFSTYLVSIEKEYVGVDTMVGINNFLNNDGEKVYCKFKDSTLTILQNAGVTGIGIYHKSQRKVTWNYEVVFNGVYPPQVRATFTKN